MYRNVKLHTVVYSCVSFCVCVKGAQRIAQSGATSEPSVTWILGAGESPRANQVSEIYKLIKSDVLGLFFF